MTCMKKETVKATCISDQGSVMQQKSWDQLTAEIVGKMGVKIGAELVAYAMLKADREGLDPELAVKFSFADFRVLSSGKRGSTDKSKRRPIRYTDILLERIYDASTDTGAERKRQGTFFVPSPLIRTVRRIDAYNRAETDQERADALKPIDYTKQARKNYALISAMQKSHIVADCVIQGDVFQDGSNTLETVDTFTPAIDVVLEQRDAMLAILKGLTNKQAEHFRNGLRAWRAGDWHKDTSNKQHKAIERIADRYGFDKATDLFETYSRLFA